MDPRIAAIAVAIGILGLFALDRDREARTSRALWIPVAWLSISASRMVSQWLGGPTAETADQLAEGSPLDALIFAGLLVAGLIVLVGRSGLAGKFLRKNGPLVAFLLYCLLSVLWSDFPFVAFKRWSKALGDLVMVLVVLTDPEPKNALRRLLSRPGFVLIPLSILFIRYFPALGRAYSSWTGEAYNTGVATGKNGLGFICLVFGLGSLWCFVENLRTRDSARKRRVLVAHGALVALTLWLFWMANSATSFACFVIGGFLIVVANLPTLVRKPIILHLLVGFVLSLSVFALIINPGAGLVQAMGRDPTLTGRTALWDQALRIPVDRLVGAGYESFWLGDRLEQMWRTNWEHPNQAHNGYLEVFLDLGWVGVVLLGLLMIWGYRNAISTFLHDPQTGRLRLAFFVVAAIYNLTEHAFRETHPVWIAFLLAVTAIPEAPVEKESVIDVEVGANQHRTGRLAAHAHACEEIT